MAEIDLSSPEYLISKSTFTCLAVIRGTDVHNAVIGLAKCNGGISQQWFPKDGVWRWGGNPDLCMCKDNKKGGVCLAPCNSVSKFWIHDEEDRMILGNQALGVPRDGPRNRVILYKKRRDSNQNWWTLSQLKELVGDDHLVGRHCLPSPFSQMCKRESNRISSLNTANSQEGNDQVHLSARETQCTSTEEAEYLVNQDTHSVLSVHMPGTCPSKAKVCLSPYSGDEKQQWFVEDGVWHWGGDRTYHLTPDLDGDDLRLTSSIGSHSSWTLDKSGTFSSGSSSLDVALEGDRTKVFLKRQGRINQKWWLLSKLKSCADHRMYPFPAKDTKVYRQELARGIINQLSSLTKPLPHPRDFVRYPGTVSKETPRINLGFTLNVATIQHTENLRIRLPRDWQATNIYVVAGETFSVILPDTLSRKQANQITVKVGAQCDWLKPNSGNVRRGNFNRMPIISEAFDVNPGVTHLRSQYGGNLIFTYNGNDSFQAKAEVANIVEAPHYVLGNTDMKEWLTMKHLDAPFAVLESEKVVLIVPTSKARDVSDPEDLLNRYDNVIKNDDYLSGFTKDDPPPQGKQWLVEDIQITAGSAHAGFPIMFNQKGSNLASLGTPHSWGVWHELGHNYQQGPYWSYAYGIETTVNLFSLYNDEKIQSQDRQAKKKNLYKKTGKAVANGLTYGKADVFEKLAFLMEIKYAFPDYGWDMYRRLNSRVRTISEKQAKALRRNRQRQVDFVYKTLSQIIGIDLLPHYMRWTLSISQKAIDEINELGLPKCPEDLSVYCPVK